MSEISNEAMQHVLKNNIMKDDFGWDIPVETVPLPSKGIIYNPDSVLHNKETLQIKAMTATEEDILLSPAYIKDGTAILQLIKSCLIDKRIDVSDLIIGDRNALLVSVRITGYGTNYDVTSRCGNCNESNDTVVDLSSLTISRLKIDPVEPGKNLFLYKLPVTGKSVVYKYLNAKDEKNRQRKQDFIKKHSGGKIENSVITFLEESIVSIEGITDKNKISHFIRNMPALDSRKLRNYIDDNSPGIDMLYSFECKNCQHENTVKLPVNSNFFWPGQ